MLVPNIPKPSSQLVERYLDQWDGLENYRLQDSSLNLLFQTLCPRNAVLDHILLKVSALNDFYSTNIYDTFSVAKHILALQVDERLTRRDKTLVNDLASVSISGKKWNMYSFASKYCSHHQPDSYPIYDYFVDRMLRYYRSRYRFCAFRNDDLGSYSKFVEIVDQFRLEYSLVHFSLRQIDIFLWLTGKKYFPRKYS